MRRSLVSPFTSFSIALANAATTFQIGDEVVQEGWDLLAFEVRLPEHLCDAPFFGFAVHFFQYRSRKRRHNLPIKLFPTVLAQISNDIFKRSTAPVRAIRRHRVERVS